MRLHPRGGQIGQGNGLILVRAQKLTGNELPGALPTKAQRSGPDVRKACAIATILLPTSSGAVNSRH